MVSYSAKMLNATTHSFPMHSCPAIKSCCDSPFSQVVSGVTALFSETARLHPIGTTFCRLISFRAWRDPSHPPYIPLTPPILHGTWHP